MPKDDLIRVRHMLDAAQKAMAFVQNQTRADLDQNEQLVLSLVRLLEIIGEAANKISNDFQAHYSDIPWRKMVDLRNRLIHGYFDIDYNIVWDTVTNDFPPLIPKLEGILPSKNKNSQTES
jgi:uncharacterized protein with HEPN domain